MNILYVEDSPMDAELVQRYIKTTSHSVSIVNTLEEARQALEMPIDLILVDVLLQENPTGRDFVQDLRRRGYAQPIIAITAMALAHDIEACYEAGFTDVLTKPYQISELKKIVSKYAE